MDVYRIADMHQQDICTALIYCWYFLIVNITSFGKRKIY